MFVLHQVAVGRSSGLFNSLHWPTLIGILGINLSAKCKPIHGNSGWLTPSGVMVRLSVFMGSTEVWQSNQACCCVVVTSLSSLGVNQVSAFQVSEPQH